MANPEHLKIIKQGVERWNKWREGHPEERPDLSGADFSGIPLAASEAPSGGDFSGVDFSGADLHGVFFWGAKLVGAKFVGANLVRAEFHGANLVGANLSGASVNGAHFSGAKLAGANLSGAGLAATNFRDSDITGVDFTGALASLTNFADVDLSAAKGLEAVVHEAPSNIGINTIYASHGKIPEVFLRGCGVPDEFINYIGYLVGRPIEFYSCFISYSTRDHEFAERLHADLQAKGVRCWFAPHDIKGGRKIHEQIDEAIRTYDKLLLILSEHSMSSTWVKTEIANAREREEREAKQLLFPITLVAVEEVKRWKLFDADRGVDSAREIREYFLPDFRNWDKDNRADQAALEKLIRDLKAQ
jgi:hypothetical protein